MKPLLLAICAAVSCRGAPAAPAPDPHLTAQVIVETASGRAHRVTAEIARTPAQRAQGLMNRERLAPDQGMLFLFEESADHTFWMKDTLIPLDMIFIAEDGRVVGIVENAEPKTLTARRVGAPSRSTLEVIGGWCAERGVAVGDRVRWEATSPPGAP